LLPETQTVAEKVWAIMGFTDLKNLPEGWCGLPYWIDAGIPRAAGSPS
jgi:hypothetical protein